MALHLVALVKLHLLSPSHSASPLIASLICSFLLKISSRLSVLRRVYIDVFHATRLFFFQLSQIALEADHPAPSNGHRWQRALRCITMALQMVVLATLLSSSHGMSPILAGLACSFLFKLSLNFNLIHQGCIDLCHGIRLLMYQMGLIAAVSISRGWQQTLHICYSRVMNARRSPAAVETSLHALTMLSL
ncbi:hypothetical protein Gotur_035707 [Gossypium turneri]